MQSPDCRSACLFAEVHEFILMKNTSYIKRTERVEKFTRISNELVQKTNLSFAAKGMICFLLSLPDNWVIHKNHIRKTFKIGQCAIDTIFDELEKTGHMVAIPIVKAEDGKFKGKNYFVYDEPVKPNNLENLTDTGFPSTVDPVTVNPYLQSTNTDKVPTNTNKHTQGDFEILNSMPAVDNGKQLPKWMARITGTVAERFTAFNKLAKSVGKKEGASSDVIEQLVNTYATDDRQYSGYMRFETERYFDLQLMMRKFIAQQEKYDEKFN